MLRTKSVHSPIKPQRDGLRILATRFRGRGLAVSRYHVWMPCLGPSEQLLRQFRNRHISWKEFGKRYEQELFESGKIDQRNPIIKNHGQKYALRLLKALAGRGTVTLMCHCPEEAKQCHRHILKRLVERV